MRPKFTSIFLACHTLRVGCSSVCGFIWFLPTADLLSEAGSWRLSSITATLIVLKKLNILETYSVCPLSTENWFWTEWVKLRQSWLTPARCQQCKVKVNTSQYHQPHSQPRIYVACVLCAGAHRTALHCERWGGHSRSQLYEHQI